MRDPLTTSHALASHWTPWPRELTCPPPPSTPGDSRRGPAPTGAGTPERTVLHRVVREHLETYLANAAHLVDAVLPRVQFRQWVLSVPKRVRWHLRAQARSRQRPAAVFLRAVETTIRQRSPGAPPGARYGAVAFVHRFGSYLNSHVHFHVLVTDGVFSADADGGAVFHPALDLAAADFAAVQAKMRQRGLRWLLRHGHLDDLAVHTLDTPDHAGGWSVDASVTVPGWDRHGLERLVRYCARPPLSGERLGRLNADDLLVYRLRKPTLDGRTELLLTPHQLLDRLAAAGDPAAAPQAPVLRRAGAERAAARGGDRQRGPGRVDAAGDRAGARADGAAGSRGRSRSACRRAAQRPVPGGVPLLGAAAGAHL